MKYIKKIIFILNYLRTFPVYLAYLASPQKELIKKDMDRWNDVLSDRVKPDTSYFKLLNRLLTDYKEFRSLILNRFKKPPIGIKSAIAYVITKMLYKPLESLYISTYDIGGGLFIQHGFATIIDAESIGENCWINQQVTIGYSGAYHPIIGNDVKILAGAKVVGKVTMGDNSVAGANAVVCKDVPANAVVGGVPAKIIKYKDT